MARASVLHIRNMLLDELVVTLVIVGYSTCGRVVGGFSGGHCEREKSDMIVGIKT